MVRQGSAGMGSGKSGANPALKDLTMGESDPEVMEGKRLLSLNHIGLDQAPLPYEKSGNIRS